MTATATNRGPDSILIGMAVALDNNGNLMLATSENSAIGVCLVGGLAAMLTTYSTDGLIERNSWAIITGTPSLSKGKAYFLAGDGKLSLGGTQKIGIAQDSKTLRVQIQAAVAPVAQIHQVTSAPDANLGRTGDFAYDTVGLAFYAKSQSGWGAPARMVQSPQIEPIYLKSSGGVWMSS